MSWIREHRRTWQLAFLVLVPATFVGPWLYDMLWVPAEYVCSPPAVRLDGDYCGLPMSGLGFFRWVIPELAYASKVFLSGDITLIDWAKDCSLGLLLSVLFLPLLSTLLLVLFGDRPRRQVFGVVSWSLAIALSLLIGLSSYPRLFWVLWGVWLYTVLAAAGVVLEALVLAAGRKLRSSDL